MGNYRKLAATAVAESFDGTQEEAESLKAAYDEIITIQQAESPYAVLDGENSLEAGDTGVTATFVDTEAGSATVPAVVTMTVTAAVSEAGIISVSLRELPAVSVAVALTDDTEAKVAAKIKAANFDGWDITGTDAEIIFTLSRPVDAVLAVTNESGEILNAYTGTWIVFESKYNEPNTTAIYTDSDFTKWFVEVEA